MADEDHRLAREEAFIGAFPTDDDDIRVATIAADAVERRLHRGLRAFQDLGDTAAMDGEGRCHADLCVVASARGEDGRQAVDEFPFVRRGEAAHEDEAM